MKTYKYVSLMVIALLVITSCKNNEQPEVKTIAIESGKEVQDQMSLDPNATYAKVEFSIDGMTCAMGCAKTIEKKMAKMDGVKSAKVDFEKELAMVEYDEAKVTPASLEEAVAMAGDVYKVKDMKQVDHFSDEKKPCDENCTKDCCKDKQKGKNTGDMKGKEQAKKMGCAEDCKKDCCAKKA